MSIFKQRCTVTNRRNTVLPQGPLLLHFGPKLPRTPWTPLFTSINGFRGGSYENHEMKIWKQPLLITTNSSISRNHEKSRKPQDELFKTTPDQNNSTPNMTGPRFHRTTEAMPRCPWKSNSSNPFVSNPIKQVKQGDTRGASEVRHSTSSIHLIISIVWSPGPPVISVPEQPPLCGKTGSPKGPCRTKNTMPQEIYYA